MYYLLLLYDRRKAVIIGTGNNTTWYPLLETWSVRAT